MVQVAQDKPKLVNMLLATTMIGVGEAFNLGKNLGLDPKNNLRFCQHQLVHAGQLVIVLLRCRTRKPCGQEFPTRFSASLMFKDLTIALKTINSKYFCTFWKKARKFQKMVKEKG